VTKHYAKPFAKMTEPITIRLDTASTRVIEMNPLDVVSVVQSVVFYPFHKSKHFVENVKNVPEKLTFSYHCDAASCTFPMAELMQSVALKGLGIRDTTHLLVHTIQENPDLFSARQCAGYSIQVNKQCNVWIKNQSVGGDVRDDTKIACIDLTALKKGLFYKYELEKLRKS
jgi:hypothetical protein